MTSATATIAVTCRYPEGAFLYGSRKPHLRVNDVDEFVLAWGMNSLELPAGSYTLEAWVPYFAHSRVGAASARVELEVGNQLDVVYQVPVFATQKGVLARAMSVEIRESHPPMPILGWLNLFFFGGLNLLLMTLLIIKYL